MTKAKELRKITIREMLEKRYTVDQISIKTGIPRRTIYKYIDKFRTEANIWFQNLAAREFIPELKSVADMIDSSIKQCYDELELIEKKYDQMIDETRSLYEESKNHEKSIQYRIQIRSKICELESNRIKERKDYIKIIQDFKIKRGQLLNKVPMVYAIEYAIKRKSLVPEPTPQIDALKVQ